MMTASQAYLTRRVILGSQCHLGCPLKSAGRLVGVVTGRYLHRHHHGSGHGQCSLCPVSSDSDSWKKNLIVTSPMCHHWTINPRDTASSVYDFKHVLLSAPRIGGRHFEVTNSLDTKLSHLTHLIRRANVITLPNRCHHSSANSRCARMILTKRYLFCTKPKRKVEEEKEVKTKGSFLQGVVGDLREATDDSHITQLQEELFQKPKEKNRETFIAAVSQYRNTPNVYRRGEVEFINSALKHMKDFNVSDDLDVYKEIVDIFPKGKMKASNAMQADFMWFPKHQDLALKLMHQMDENGVLPDEEFGHLLVDIFGLKSFVVRKYRRTLYWATKLKYENPYYVPVKLPSDRLELAKMALEKICVDLDNRITVFESSALSETATPEELFIATAQSGQQQALLAVHPTDQPVVVEGGFLVWLRRVPVTFFVLKSENVVGHPEDTTKEEDEFDFSFTSFFGTTEGGVCPPDTSCEHHQEDGTIYAIAITSSGSKPSLISWIDCLQKTNPRLRELTVLFKMRTPESGIQKM
ncbi:evolutionarily conserved signaling intermediate in Toll pathway, mitochondrial [Lingula anatina]|uniref:Evolutionarily conserved signaling intermediate in Toll pathway, mitochondrial n=1 Tax=Lingula anatina TaxID=7574 RepID=A0A1S3H364_LINAN|nr:evolutionarily conserved signaling intermediate in Toll pathway, mitochondrial [Lingula anatina]XP_013380452.1 evolutionarily conserved signaling intermediate in Toll pathway, mitochondrial [Lingula anatina]XP_013380453.1 evolutionarily conserved signaling intermediate in Toll pathway, mitochondrial [Lingula anatina]|eukprot:XP_013380451.1 evolutionarily conserved signaling intermediate in Toll pathway, mitochondrial [Lingula anatina]